MTNPVIVRLPPSPTGNLHIGTARTALFNYLFAKKHAGKVLLRFEDTDKERSKKEFESNIVEGLNWLGISYDNQPVRQSERTVLYKEALKSLIDNGAAYISKEPSRNDPNVEVSVIRLKNPGKSITFTDLVRGDITFDTTELGDFVIAKNMEEPLYHLAVVFDDQEMGVTHVIRGEDHISNTPRQILIQEALGYPRPIYAHIPLILATDRSKLSKRHGATALTDYRDKGYLPQGMINYLALLGWNPGTEKEIFSMDELIAEFDINKIQKGGAVFDEKKLRWVNKEHIKRLPKEVLSKILSGKIGKDLPEGLAEVVVERIEVFSDIDALIKNGDLEYFFSAPALDRGKIAWKNSSPEEAKEHLEKISSLIESGGDIMAYANGDGKARLASTSDSKSRRGNVLWPLRYALSGKDKSPDPFTLMKILGKEESLRRLNSAIVSLN